MFASCGGSNVSPDTPENGTEQTDPEDPATPDDPDDPDTPDTPDEPDTPEEPSDGIIRILAIGNSFSQDAVEQYLWNLFDAAGTEVIIGNLYIGGCTLATHIAKANADSPDYAYRKVVDGSKTEKSGYTMAQGLSDEKWDYISFQQASGSSGVYSTYKPYLSQLMEYVSSHTQKKAEYMFHQTWAYAASSDHAEFPKYDKNQLTMYNAIVSASKSAVEEHGIGIVIPSGTAVQNGRSSYLGDSFNRDGYHLETTYGRYTAACTWFETISGKSVVGNEYHPATISDDIALLCQTAAHTACLNPWKITDMVDFKQPYIGDEDFSHPVQVDFGGGSSIAPESWTRVASYSISDPVYLKNTEGVTSSVRIDVLEGFTSTFNGVGSEPDTEITIGDMSFPKSVWSDAIAVSGTKGEGDVGPARVVLGGLDPESHYDIIILAVRYNGSAAARTSEYTVSGKTQSEVKSINPGLKTMDAVESYDDFAVSFSGVAPAADGSISISVVGKDTGVAAEGHISALIINSSK